MYTVGTHGVNKMIYISAGHHHEKQGASYNGFTEHEEAKIWVSLIDNLLGYGSMVVPVGILKNKVAFINERAKQNDLAVEIHFNSALDNNGDPIGEGSETLYYPTSARGKAIAECVQDSLGELMHPNRGAKEGYYQMDKTKGADFFLARTVCTAIIIEPEFIHMEDNIINNREEACNVIANSLIEALLDNP